MHFILDFILKITLTLRKEVIQPHLPIRLPCYDFTPVIEPAFDSSLPLLSTNLGFAKNFLLNYLHILLSLL